MACHEIAALRLGLMQILGRDDEAERQHELAELGKSAEGRGPLRALCEARDLASVKKFFDAALSELTTKVANARLEDPKLPYLRSLMVLTKQVELDLDHQVDALSRFYKDLEEMHDFVHEIYPAR